MASTPPADAETNDSSITKPPDSDNPNETAGINLSTAQNRKISFLEKVETFGSPTSQTGTNGQTPDTHDAEITRKQSIPPLSQPPKSVLKQRVDWIAPSPGGAPSSARPPTSIPPSSLTPPLPTPPLPDPGYYAQKSSAPPSLTGSSGPSPYFSPPISWLPSHMRRGRKSVPNSTGKSPSMLQECFSAENSPYYTAPNLTPGYGAADLPNSGGGFEQETEETGESDAGPNDLLFASGRSRLKGAPMTIRWNAKGNGVEFPSIVLWHLSRTSSPQDAENVLSDLLHATRLGEIGQEWITALEPGEGLLQDLFKVADQITPVESALNPKSPCAEIIDLLLEHIHIDSLLTRLCRPYGSGATSIRYLICKARSMGKPPGEPGDGGSIVPWVADTAARHAYEIASMSGADSLSMIPAIRLVESVLPSVRTLDQLQRPIYRSFLEAVIRLIKRKELARRGEQPEVDPARRTAALHLISSTLRTYKSLLGRLEAESDMPAMPEKEWILEELGITDIVPYLQDENSHPLVRCMALRVLRDFADVDVEEVPRWEKLEDILVIAVDVLLWRTKWQHGHEETSKSLDIAKFCPHEDAYRVVTSSPADFVIPILSKALKADDKFALLEPLLSLIVDHSKLKDKYWPFMLSMLLHCGCLSLFHDILLPPVPPEKDPLYRKTCRTKTDACIGLTRCFEQMRAKDVKTIPSDVGATLVRVANDEQLPLNLQGGAGDAFGALKENIPTSLEMALEAPRPLNNKLDSTPRSPQPAAPPPKTTPEPHPTALESPTLMPVPEPVKQDQHEIEPDKHALSLRSDPKPKGISTRQVAAFPDAEEVDPRYPQVRSHPRGGYPDYELGSDRIYTPYRSPGPSSQSPPVDIPEMSTRNSRRVSVNSATDEGEPRVVSVAPPRGPTAEPQPAVQPVPAAMPEAEPGPVEQEHPEVPNRTPEPPKDVNQPVPNKNPKGSFLKDIRAVTELPPDPMTTSIAPGIVLSPVRAGGTGVYEPLPIPVFVPSSSTSTVAPTPRIPHTLGPPRVPSKTPSPVSRARTPEVQPAVPALTSSSAISAVPDKSPKRFVPKDVNQPVPFGYRTPTVGHGRQKVPLGRPNPAVAYSLTARTPRLQNGMTTRDGLPAITPEPGPETHLPVVPPSLGSSSPMTPPGAFDDGPSKWWYGYRIPSPPAQPFSVGLMTPNLTSRPGTADPWANAPEGFQPAAAVATRRTAVSVFDKDFKTPRTIFEPISSDQSSIYDPNSPDQQFHLLSGATPDPQYAGLPGGEDDDEEPAPFTPNGTGGSWSSSIAPGIPSGSGISTSRFRPALRKPESVTSIAPRVSVHSITDEDEPKDVPVAIPREPSPPPPSPPRPARRSKGKGKRR